MNRFSLFLPAALVLLCGCQATPAPLSEQDRTANQSLTDAFVKHLLAREFDSLAALYADDGRILAPNRPEVLGRDGVRQFAASYPPLREFRAMNEAIEGSGDVAYVRGRYAAHFALEGNSVDSGKFLEIRRRQRDGSWKITIDMFNSSLPPAPTRGRAP
jgi:ketosteroid isomerase-like protein